MNYRIIRIKDLSTQLSLSKSTIKNKVQEKLLPPPVSLGERAIGWISSEVDACIKLLAENASKEEIQAYVNSLKTKRSFKSTLSGDEK